MVQRGGWLRPSFRATLRNRSIENRSNDNRFRINWSHSVKLTGYVFLRSPPRPTVDFHSSNSSISTSAFLPPAPPLILNPFTSRPRNETTLFLSASSVAPRILYPQTFSRDSPSLFIFPFMPSCRSRAQHSPALCFSSGEHNFELQFIRFSFI